MIIRSSLSARALSITALVAVFALLPQASAQETLEARSDVNLMALAKPCVDSSRNKSREEVCGHVNKERTGRKVGGIRLDSQLSRVAQAFAEDMHRRGYFSHESPSGSTMSSRLKNAGVEYGWAGENIARGQDDSQEVVEDWMNSSGHRRNILNSKFNKLGVGRAGSIWVQIFTD